LALTGRGGLLVIGVSLVVIVKDDTLLKAENDCWYTPFHILLGSPPGLVKEVAWV
jgi:hypothetical protein